MRFEPGTGYRICGKQSGTGADLNLTLPHYKEQESYNIDE
jgi:acetoin utilization deacetylase AcuC-like enzyme